MIKDIVISATLTIIIGVILSLCAVYAFEIPFYKSMIVITVLQLAGFYIWNSLLQYKMKRHLITEETKRMEMYSSQGVETSCAYCGTSNFIPVRFDEDNSYECEGCGKTNSVYIKITTAQVTDIIESENLSVSTYIKEKMDLTEKIKNS